LGECVAEEAQSGAGQATSVCLRDAMEEQRPERLLSLRALTHTAGRWTRFWQKGDQFGAECCC
jgi:hypothetical protein